MPEMPAGAARLFGTAVARREEEKNKQRVAEDTEKGWWWKTSGEENCTPEMISRARNRWYWLGDDIKILLVKFN